MSSLILIAHNLRSSQNVGALLRTADGLGVKEAYLTGYSPYPLQKGDKRLPHESQKVHRQIAKTALGAENSIGQHHTDIAALISQLKSQGYAIVALEQAKDSINLPEFTPPEKLAIIVGRETAGIEPEILEQCDKVLEIPMSGKKESFNVAIAAAIALYHIKYKSTIGRY